MGQIVALAPDALCTAAEGVQVMSTPDAFFGFVIAVPYLNCIWSTPSKEARGPLLREACADPLSYEVTESGVRHLQFGGSFLGLISGGSDVYWRPNSSYWDMGLVISLWCLRAVVLATMLLIFLGDAFGSLSSNREHCIIVASVTGNVLFGCTIVEWVIAAIRKFSLGDEHWWENSGCNIGLVWECAALGFPLSCGTYRKTPPVSQLGLDLSKKL